MTRQPQVGDIWRWRHDTGEHTEVFLITEKSRKTQDYRGIALFMWKHGEYNPPKWADGYIGTEVDLTIGYHGSNWEFVS